MGTKKNKGQKKIILPPELPPEISEDEIQVSDEDLQFVDENREYAGFVSRLDTQSITKFVFLYPIFSNAFNSISCIFYLNYMSLNLGTQIFFFNYVYYLIEELEVLL